MAALLRRSLRGGVRGFQRALRAVGLYERTKASWIYRLYWRVVDRRVLEDINQEVEFYRSILSDVKEEDVIFDIGANQGYKTGIFLALGAKVIAIEPDRVTRAELEGRFIRYRLRRLPVTIVEAAVSDQCGSEILWIEPGDAAKNTLSRKWVNTLRDDDGRFGHEFTFPRQEEVTTTTLDKLLSTYGKPRFIKIDVEGHEVAVLEGLSSPVPYLSFEVNLPEFRGEALKCVERLNELSPESRFNYVVDCRRGFALAEWLPAKAVVEVISDCGDDSIEVFWRGCDYERQRKSAHV